MICPRCGTVNGEGTERCQRCAGSLAPPPARGTSPDQGSNAPEATEAAGVISPDEAPQPPELPQDDAPPSFPADDVIPASQRSPFASREGSDLDFIPPFGPPPPLPDWPPPRQPAESRSGAGRWPPSPQEGGWPGQERVIAGPPNYVVQALLCTVVFNLLAGVVAIVYSRQVNRKVMAGDLDGAARSSRLARIWCWVSVVMGVTGWVLILGGVVQLG